MCEKCERVPVKIKRRPITAITEAGMTTGLWYAMPKPLNEEPPNWRLKKNQRILWCPWCASWAIYQRTAAGNRWNCTGVCGWGNTDEFHVKTKNSLWGE